MTLPTRSARGADAPPPPAPATGWLPATVLAAPANTPEAPGADVRNLALIAAGCAGVLALLPPAHEYPIIDDWIYYNSVQHQLATGAFEMPGLSQTTLVGLTLWGTAWARVFGLSYTTLTWSTITLGILGLFAFYVLLRRCGVGPPASLLGVALLGFNPLYLHLSYSFMTDVPFLALSLAAAYGYMRGLQGGRAAWLWGGGLLVGWSFLIRPFAVMIPAGFVGYLVLQALQTRRIRWRALIAIVAPPALIIGAWWLWSKDMPPTGAAQAAANRRAEFMLKEVWLQVFTLRALASLPLTALSVPVVYALRRRRWWLLAPAALLVAAGWVAFTHLEKGWITTTPPSFTFTLGPVRIDLPQQLDTFVGVGNIVRVGGIDFFEYNQQMIWTPEIWTLVFLGATLLGIALLAKLGDGALDWLGALWRRRALGAWQGVYLAGLAIFVVSMAALSDFYDRYVLGFLPFIILFVVRGAAGWGRTAWRVSAAGAVVWALFSVLAQADAVDHDNARWQAAEWLAARVSPVHAGFDWDNVRGRGNGAYEISDIANPDFRVEARFPYTSRLSGGATRYVLAEARADTPPLPPPRAPGAP
jgi:hypothetical protein